MGEVVSPKVKDRILDMGEVVSPKVKYSGVRSFLQK
jgi:hypothetical protein